MHQNVYDVQSTITHFLRCEVTNQSTKTFEIFVCLIIPIWHLLFIFYRFMCIDPEIKEDSCSQAKKRKMTEVTALPDTHLSCRAFFPVPEEKLEEAKTSFERFYEKTRAGTIAAGKTLYYGFAIGKENN